MTPATIAAITGLVTAVTALIAAVGGIWSAARAHGKISVLQGQSQVGARSSQGSPPDGSH